MIPSSFRYDSLEFWDQIAKKPFKFLQDFWISAAGGGWNFPRFAKSGNPREIFFEESVLFFAPISWWFPRDSHMIPTKAENEIKRKTK